MNHFSQMLLAASLLCLPFAAAPLGLGALLAEARPKLARKLVAFGVVALIIVFTLFACALGTAVLWG